MIGKKENSIIDCAVSLAKKVLFIDFIKGLSVTLSCFFTKPITMQYPDKEKWVPYPRYRGLHNLNRDEKGRELCVACELCSKACPTDCITVVPMEDDNGVGISDRIAKIWEVNLVRCLFCGYCEDACPTLAIRLGRDYEAATTDFSTMVLNKETLLKPQEIPETHGGGVVVKARYGNTNEGIKVKPDLLRQRDWWPTKKL
ncbi:MAG: NADH-quinone oxidoreductase subunit I [Deltaproteobacteria bacterium]|nr:NADH-quinone oxidoreductase subunit I [Deltaproteobacteria bacterium]